MLHILSQCMGVPDSWRKEGRHSLRLLTQDIEDGLVARRSPFQQQRGQDHTGGESVHANWRSLSSNLLVQAAHQVYNACFQTLPLAQPQKQVQLGHSRRGQASSS